MVYCELTDVLREIEMDAIKVESHPFTYDDAPIVKIIHAVAWTKGCEPESLDPLYEAIDPDALAALLETNQGSH